MYHRTAGLGFSLEDLAKIFQLETAGVESQVQEAAGSLRLLAQVNLLLLAALVGGVVWNTAESRR